MAGRGGRRPNLSPAEMEARHEERRRKVEAAHEQLADGVARLVNGDEWRAMLAASVRFHDYSWRNVLLILAQRPDARRVAGYRTWQSLGRQVRKGEKGIAVIAPVSYRTTPEDEGNGEDEGSPGERRIQGWKVEHVFDISQTEGEPLPDVVPALVEGEGPAGLWDALAEQVAAEGFDLVREDPGGGAFGSMTRSEVRVRVRPGLPEAQACKTLGHELAHVLLGHGSESCTDPRSRREVEAESVAFVVMTAAGLLDTSGYSFPYVAGWANGDLEAIEQTAETVIRTARAIVERLDEPAAVAV
jgi:antirestriction protein ArdC